MNSASTHPATGSARPQIVASYALPVGETFPTQWLDELPGMFFLGRAGKNRSLEWISDRGCAFFGLKPAEPFELAPLIHPDDRAMVLEMIATAIAAHQPVALEYRVRHTSGDWRTVWEQSKPVQHGHEILLQGQLLDVTQRVQNERAKLSAEYDLLQNQKAYALNKLAASIAHEFNNIIAGIWGSAELVALDVQDNVPARESLKQIFDASNRARDFVFKIRGLAQRPPLERKLIPLAPVIEECLSIFRSIIPEKVEIVAQLASGCPAIYADAAALQQMLLEVCLFAWQGMPDRRGRLDISLEHQTGGKPISPASGNQRSGPQLHLAVRDNGPGLDKSALDKIFDPFRSRKNTAKQVGLEMFLVRETMQAHQGEIHVESDAENGMTFHLYLPVPAET